MVRVWTWSTFFLSPRRWVRMYILQQLGGLGIWSFLLRLWINIMLSVSRNNSKAYYASHSVMQINKQTGRWTDKPFYHCFMFRSKASWKIFFKFKYILKTDVRKGYCDLEGKPVDKSAGYIALVDTRIQLSNDKATCAGLNTAERVSYRWRARKLLHCLVHT